MRSGLWLPVGPHWKFGTFDLKFLEDPANVYGGEETINAFTRADLPMIILK